MRVLKRQWRTATTAAASPQPEVPGRAGNPPKSWASVRAAASAAARARVRDTVSESPENELLLHCARTRLDPARAQRIRELVEQQPDWEKVLRAGIYHRVAPFLLRQLRAACADALPLSVLDALRRACTASVQSTLRNTGELWRILRLFEAHGIAAIPLKGPLLGVYAYGDLSLRGFGDLDILVPERDVRRARGLLISDGYRSLHSLTPEQDWILQRFSHHFSLVPDGGGGATVELHWRLSSHVRLPCLEELWQRGEDLSLGGHTVRTLSPEDLVLFLCVHGSQHVWSALEWIVGVAELIQRHELDWSAVIVQAEERGVGRRLRLGLFLAAELLEAPLPAEVRDWVEADPRAGALAAWVAERLFIQQADSPRTLTYAVFRFQLKVRSHLRDRLRYCHRVLAKPNAHDRELIELPSALYPMYLLVRLFRLAGKQARNVLSRMS